MNSVRIHGRPALYTLFIRGLTLYIQVGGMLEVKDEDIAGLLTDMRPGKQLPPVAVVLAGLVAPVQLAFVVTLNRFLLSAARRKEGGRDRPLQAFPR